MHYAFIKPLFSTRETFVCWLVQNKCGEVVWSLGKRLARAWYHPPFQRACWPLSRSTERRGRKTMWKTNGGRGRAERVRGNKSARPPTQHIHTKINRVAIRTPPPASPIHSFPRDKPGKQPGSAAGTGQLHAAAEKTEWSAGRRNSAWQRNGHSTALISYDGRARLP